MFPRFRIFSKKRLKIQKILGETSMACLVDPSISEYEQFKRAEIIKQVIKKATK